MDNLTHSLFGAALAKTPLGKLSPFAAPALVIGANLPDLDIVVWLCGKDAYLEYHRGITHAAVGVLGLTLLGAVLLRGLERRFAPARGGSFLAALALLAVAIASHPALDYLNNYGVRPWLPFDARWFYGDTVFILDPWLWLLFGGAAALAGPRSLSGSLGLALCALVGTAAIVLTARGPAILYAWPFLALAVAWLRLRGVGERRPGRVLALFGVASALYLGLLAVQSQRAAGEGARVLARTLGPEEPVEELAAMPAPADPWRWLVLARTPLSIWALEMDLRSGPGLLERYDRGARDALVAQALAAPCTAAWHSFARFPHAALVPTANGADVHLMDARYQDSPQSERLRGELDGEGEPARTWSSAVVEFDAEGAIQGCED